MVVVVVGVLVVLPFYQSILAVKVLVLQVPITRSEAILTEAIQVEKR